MNSIEIQLLDKLIFKPKGIKLSKVEKEPESQEYLAHTFLLNEQIVKFRKAKITPTKQGQFVTIWKRNMEGITAPFHILDEFDYIIIYVQNEKLAGVFIFPKEILHEKKIISDEKKEGKRGIRVYPPWDLVTSKQALKTQEWQVKHFEELSII